MIELFNTKDTQHRSRNGTTCHVVRTIAEPDATHDAEVLPMHLVRFSDGFELEVFPDELSEPQP